MRPVLLWMAHFFVCSDVACVWSCLLLTDSVLPLEHLSLGFALRVHAHSCRAALDVPL